MKAMAMAASPSTEDFAFVMGTSPFSSPFSSPFATPSVLSRASSPLPTPLHPHSPARPSATLSRASSFSSQESWVNDEMTYFDGYEHYLDELLPHDEEGPGQEGFILLSHPDEFLPKNPAESQFFESDPMRIELPPMFEDFDPKGPRPCGGFSLPLSRRVPSHAPLFVPRVCTLDFRAALLRPPPPGQARFNDPISEAKLKYDALLANLCSSLLKHRQKLLQKQHPSSSLRLRLSFVQEEEADQLSHCHSPCSDLSEEDSPCTSEDEGPGDGDRDLGIDS